ncbi:MAG: ATP-dependent Clp protease ATP-binding subunit ClpX [Butyrivibrio sp.]|nr:ATP-dependent Clp protease ATP-binding subunit ClpX [Butyrivibrio sp.]
MTDKFDFREVTDDERVDIIDTPVATTATGASDITKKNVEGSESIENSSESDGNTSGQDKGTSDTSGNNNSASGYDSNNNKSEYEDVCFVCRRPESKAGKMFHMPNNICVCNDCLQKTMDNLSQFDYQGLLNNPNLMNELNKNAGGFPNIGFLNMGDLQNGNFNFGGGIPNIQKIKKKSESTVKPAFDIKNIPAPHKIKEKLDEFVIGQDQAKKVMSVAVYNHYKRVATDSMDDIEIEKSNILLLGPTGSGKTYLVKTLAKLLDVPLAIADATSLTEAGYIGDDIESVVSKLLAAAGNDVEKTEHGIIFIDEIDKIAKKKNTTSRDVSGESVQQGMLKLLEGSNVEVPVGAGSKNAMVPLATVNTRNILFICGGAFPDLEEIITQRLNKQTSIGFDADLKDKYEDDPNLLTNVTVDDLKKFGMIPEFLGRLPIICTLQALTKEMLIKILKEPKNAILKQYQKLLALDEVDLEFDDGALEAIAEKAMEKDTGARALRAIIEEFMLDIMYEIPKDENIGRVTITRDYIEGKASPLIEIRGDQVQHRLPQFNTETATSL